MLEKNLAGFIPKKTSHLKDEGEEMKSWNFDSEFLGVSSKRRKRLGGANRGRFDSREFLEVIVHFFSGSLGYMIQWLLLVVVGGVCVCCCCVPFWGVDYVFWGSLIFEEPEF